jgi:hypothetical protein
MQHSSHKRRKGGDGDLIGQPRGALLVDKAGNGPRSLGANGENNLLAQQLVT